jgi:hypothetical protein
VELEASGAIAMDADERDLGGAGEWALSWTDWDGCDER